MTIDRILVSFAAQHSTESEQLPLGLLLLAWSLTNTNRDVLRRHEKTCRARCPSVVNSRHNLRRKIEPHDDRASKRNRTSTDSSLTTSVVPFPEAGVVDPKGTDHTVETSYPFQQDSRSNESEYNQISMINPEESHLTWVEDQTTLFNLFGQFSDDLVSMPPLDFSALNGNLFPQENSDLFIAERLEFMAYFTSSQGMKTFADRESFRHQQEMAREGYESKQEFKMRPTQDKISIPEALDLEFGQDIENLVYLDPLDSKSRELVESLRDVISNKRNDDIITLEWTMSINKLCTDFFKPSNMRRFLEYFWSLWYPHCPIVHRPLFDPSSASPELLCVMITIGACLSPSEHDNETSRKWLDSVEELIFRQVYFRSDRELFPGHPSQRKDIVQCMQAAYLVSSLQKREGSAEAQARMRRHRHTSMVTVS